MGDVAISLKVTPEGTEVNLEDLKDRIDKVFPVEDSQTEKIGFGLTALKILIVRDEEKGGTDDIENRVEEIEDVASVVVENVSLL